MSIDRIHTLAVEASIQYKKAEATLVEILQEVEAHGVFFKRGHSSLFRYVTDELRVGENSAYDLITVARKARDVPALGTKLREGALTLCKARRVASVLTRQNQDEWIEKACSLSSRKLEKEIARVRPETATPERVSYASADRVKVELGMSERDMLQLRRAQDLLSQSRRRAVSLEETLATMTSEFLRRHDPVEKAKRHTIKKTPSAPLGELGTGRVGEKRAPLPAPVVHAVNLRDQRRCTEQLPDGSRCNQARWVDIHHKIPVSQGGEHTVDNLITLCSAHHRLAHLPRPD